MQEGQRPRWYNKNCCKMENSDKQTPSTPNYTNPNKPVKSEAPPDPSNTSHIGQQVEQGVISKKEGISEQSGKWEDRQESDIPATGINEAAEKYIKDPSPEEVNHEEREDEADKLMGGRE